jgi:hypothetical protein
MKNSKNGLMLLGLVLGWVLCGIARACGIAEEVPNEALDNVQVFSLMTLLFFYPITTLFSFVTGLYNLSISPRGNPHNSLSSAVTYIQTEPMISFAALFMGVALLPRMDGISEFYKIIPAVLSVAGFHLYGFLKTRGTIKTDPRTRELAYTMHASVFTKILGLPAFYFAQPIIIANNENPLLLFGLWFVAVYLILFAPHHFLSKLGFPRYPFSFLFYISAAITTLFMITISIITILSQDMEGWHFFLNFSLLASLIQSMVIFQDRFKNIAHKFNPSHLKTLTNQSTQTSLVKN